MTDAASEMVLYDFPIQNGLGHNALDMLRLDPSIPNALAGKRIALEAGRDVDDDIPCKLVTTNMTYHSDSCSR